MDNRLEFDNNLIDTNNSNKHIKSRPHYPQTNGVVESVHKEIKKIVLIK